MMMQGKKKRAKRVHERSMQCNQETGHGYCPQYTKHFIICGNEKAQTAFGDDRDNLSGYKVDKCVVKEIFNRDKCRKIPLVNRDVTDFQETKNNKAVINGKYDGLLSFHTHQVQLHICLLLPSSQTSPFLTF